MKQSVQFGIGLVVGLFVWKFYDFISMAFTDGLISIGVTDPYQQTAFILVVLGVIIFAGIHGGMKLIMDRL